MIQLPLSALPNQSISFNADGAYWQITVYQGNASMVADVIRQGVTVCSGVRCYPGIPLMQYEYMYAPNFGNFVFDSEVDWTDFASSCFLYYLSNSEFASFQSLQK